MAVAAESAAAAAAAGCTGAVMRRVATNVCTRVHVTSHDVNTTTANTLQIYPRGKTRYVLKMKVDMEKVFFTINLTSKLELCYLIPITCAFYKLTSGHFQHAPYACLVYIKNLSVKKTCT